MTEVTAFAACWGDTSQGLASVKKLHHAAPAAPIGSYVTALTAGDDETALARKWGELIAAGSDELHIYHLGLASTHRIEAIAAAINAIRS